MIKLRGQDKYGFGHYQAPRGSRLHNGVDICNVVNEAIEAYQDGHVSKIGYPYADEDKQHFRYVEITCDNSDMHRYFYVESLVRVGDEVEKGAIIGWAQDLSVAYPGIKQHIHFEVKLKDGSFIDPVAELKRLGHKFEGEI